jgi:AraC-like DNA-binding protein
MLIDAAHVRCTRTAHHRADEESSTIPTLVLPQRGVFRYHVGARTTIADSNTVLLFHPSEPYRISHPTDHGDHCIALRFDRDALTDALGFASESAQAWTPDPRTQRALHRAANAALSAHDALAREVHAFDVLALVGGAEPVVSNARDAARIDAVRERLAADVGAQASLAAIARDAGLSPFHLARRFRARTGASLHQYRLALRLAVAHAMLLEGVDDLTRVALDLGFASPAHFSAAFRQAYACSPSAVRTRSVK